MSIANHMNQTCPIPTQPLGQELFAIPTNHSFFELNPPTVYEHVYYKNNSFRAKDDGRKLECVMRNICLNWAWSKRVNKETIKCISECAHDLYTLRYIVQSGLSENELRTNESVENLDSVIPTSGNVELTLTKKTKYYDIDGEEIKELSTKNIDLESLIGKKMDICFQCKTRKNKAGDREFSLIVSSVRIHDRKENL